VIQNNQEGLQRLLSKKVVSVKDGIKMEGKSLIIWRLKCYLKRYA